MLETIIGKIKTVCESIPNIQEVYEYPLQADPTKFPAIIFFLDNVDNSFETTGENMKIYNFKLYVVINVGGKSVKQIYQNILPKTFDDVSAGFDSDWDFGSFNGHRIWAKFTSSLVGLSVEQKGKTATLDFNIQVKALTDN